MKRVIRPATDEERKRHEEVRKQVTAEFPPKKDGGRKPSPPGLPSQIRAAREAQGLTWFALAQKAGLASANVVRDIEYGRDAPLSDVQAIARALGMKIELAEQTVP